MRASLVLWVVIAAAACAKGGAPAPGADDGTCCPCPTGQQQRPLSRELMAVLAAARGHHHQADIHLRQGELDAAIAKVRAILALGLDSRWPEAEEVRVDATARLAKLLLQGEKPEEALKLVDVELAKDLRPSFYQANLHSVRGELLEARVKVLDQKGEKEQAKTMAREALAAFERSIRINKALQLELQKKRKKGAAAGGGR